VAREEDALKEADIATLYALGVPVTSLKSLAEFGREMKQMNVPISAAVIDVIMDDDSEFPQISFKCVGFLTEDSAKKAVTRGEKAEWKLGQVTRAQIAAPIPNLALPGQPQSSTPQPAAPAAPAAPAEAPKK